MINAKEQLEGAGLGVLLLPLPVGNPVRRQLMGEACASGSCWRFFAAFWSR